MFIYVVHSYVPLNQSPPQFVVQNYSIPILADEHGTFEIVIVQELKYFFDYIFHLSLYKSLIKV